MGLTEVAGVMGRLAAGLETLGHKVTCVELEPHRFAYNADRKPTLLQRWMSRLGPEPDKPCFLQWVQRILLVLWAGLTHRAFVLLGGDSFTHTRRSWDLRMLRLLRRKIVFVMLGTDHRPLFLSYHGWRKTTAAGDGAGSPVTVTELASRTSLIQRRVLRAERWADAIIGHGMSAQYHSRPVVSLLRTGLPVQRPGGVAEPARRPPFQGRRLVALHCPSAQDLKGTAIVRETVARLQARGAPLDLRELHGVPNREVWEALRECDFVIDELFSDTPMAVFASEAALMGRAAVVGGYGWAELENQLPRREWPPVFTTTAEELESTLEQLLAHPEIIEDMGKRAQAFVQQHWSAERVASRLCEVLAGRTSPEWLIDPRAVTYAWGTGLRPWQARLMTRALVQHGGEAALGLASCPPVRTTLMAMTEPPPDSAAALERRVLELEQILTERERKLEDFRSMIARRDERIRKLEKKLGLRSRTDEASS